ncbi:MAG: DegT/DnrJ/EryC1/StrS family aminotransferase [Chloroflexi bacterium]|nr:DegT/DnrJ/EryC1/StrS family aminotransferase [Chloroflexota bacterium]
MPIVDLKAQYETIKEEVNAAIQQVLQHGQFILGPEVKVFEEEIAAYCGTQYAVGVASGTDALRLALLACGIGSGDEVITTPFTFVATAETIIQCGATPVFVDISPRTYNIDPRKIEEKISTRTKAILPVHLYGQAADIEPIMQLAREHNLKVIEDAAQALGAEYKGKKVGSIGDAGCLSFFPSKSLGAYGDGGMVVTSDTKIAETVDLLRKHGAKTSYYYDLIGFNSRLDTLQAAILSVKLKHLNNWTELRQSKAALYHQLLSKIDGIEPHFVEQFGRPSFNYYTIRVKDSKLNRDILREYLSSSTIQTIIYYPLSLHLQEAYKYLGFKQGDFPESEQAQKEVLSLPMYPEISTAQIQHVVSRIREFVGNS